MTGYRRIAAFLAVAGLSATAGAALWDRHRAAPAETLVMLSACGLVPAPDPVALPLASLFAEDTPRPSPDPDADPGADPGTGPPPDLAGGLAAGLALGPIRHPGLDAPLRVRFEARDIPADAGDDPLRIPALRPYMKGAAAEGGVLVVPVARNRVPDAIRLACRHGHVAEVRHRHGGTWHHLPVTPDPQAAPGQPGAAKRHPDPDRPRATEMRAQPAPGGPTDPIRLPAQQRTVTLAGD